MIVFIVIEKYLKYAFTYLFWYKYNIFQNFTWYLSENSDFKPWFPTIRALVILFIIIIQKL